MEQLEQYDLNGNYIPARYVQAVQDVVYDANEDDVLAAALQVRRYIEDPATVNVFDLNRGVHPIARQALLLLPEWEVVRNLFLKLHSVQLQGVYTPQEWREKKNSDVEDYAYTSDKFIRVHNPGTNEVYWETRQERGTLLARCVLVRNQGPETGRNEPYIVTSFEPGFFYGWYKYLGSTAVSYSMFLLS